MVLVRVIIVIKQTIWVRYLRVSSFALHTANKLTWSTAAPKFKPVGNIMRTQSDVFAASSNSTAPVDRLHPLLRNRTPSQNIPPLTRVALPPPYSSNNTTVTLPPPQISLLPLVNIVTKRRLGMGRGPMGYPNKKFKPPT